jgi:membrane-bound lytic murein transglycosylase A
VPPADQSGQPQTLVFPEIDTCRRQVLAGREIAWLADPIDARCRAHPGLGPAGLTDPQRRRAPMRVAFNNDQPFKSDNGWPTRARAT